MIILLVIVVFALMYTGAARSEEINGSKNFHVSNGMSKQRYEQMKKDGMSADDLKLFIILEDKLLGFEKEKTSRIKEALIVSNQIKEKFKKYDFSYHTKHIKNIAEPYK